MYRCLIIDLDTRFQIFGKKKLRHPNPQRPKHTSPNCATHFHHSVSNESLSYLQLFTILRKEILVKEKM